MLWLIVWAIVLVVLCALFRKTKIDHWLFWAILFSVSVFGVIWLAAHILLGTLAILIKIVVVVAVLAILAALVRGILKLGS